MALNIHGKLHVAFGALPGLFQLHSRATALVVTLLVVSLGLVPRAYHDYKIFLSYGPGGIPYNVFGWLVATVFLGPMRTETLSTAMYEQYEDEKAWLPLGGLSRRGGERPVIGPHVVPQRQLNQIPSKEIQAVRSFILADLGHHFDEWHASTEACYIIRSSSAWASAGSENFPVSKREAHSCSLCCWKHIAFADLQGIDGRDMSYPWNQWSLRACDFITAWLWVDLMILEASLNSWLCLRYIGKTVIEAGWGQRHPLDGSKALKRLTGMWLPNQYIFIYAPRNEEEISVVMQIVTASVEYMTRSEVA
jgi:hypothetical protein